MDHDLANIGRRGVKHFSGKLPLDYATSLLFAIFSLDYHEVQGQFVTPL
jgi:hypothetical protein